jgi:hypothetical protein
MFGHTGTSIFGACGARVTRRPRIPATFSDRVQALYAVATEHVEPGAGIYVQPVQHDDDCPGLEAQSLAACTCEPIFAPPVRVETADDLEEYLRRRCA